MADLITVTNLIGGTVVIHSAYIISGISNTVDIPKAYLQENVGARESLASLITSLSVRATYSGTVLTADDILTIGSSTNYWQKSEYQAAIASGTVVLDVPLDPCKISKVSATLLGSVLAAGESMSVDIQKIDPSTGIAATIMTAPAVVDDTTITVAAQPQSLAPSLDLNLAQIGAGWPVQAVLTYVPGGGATGVDFLLTVAFAALD